MKSRRIKSQKNLPVTRNFYKSCTGFTRSNTVNSSKLNILLCAIFVLFLCTFILLSLSQRVYAQETLASNINSILLPPSKSLNKLYQSDLSKLNNRQLMQIKIHGLRMGALDTNLWGVRRLDRTENRNIVPIRPFYLRASEDPNFRLQELQITLKFKAAKERHMLMFPSQKTAIVDIGLAGQYQKGEPGARAKQDSGYVVRLTAFPEYSSGFYYRSHLKYKKLQGGEPERHAVDKEYRVRVVVKNSGTHMIVNDRLYSSIPKKLDIGLISIVSGWHPADISDIQINALQLQEDKSKQNEIRLSGLLRDVQ